MAEGGARRCVAVVGPSVAPGDVVADAESVGRGIAERGWAMLCGGRAAGVMAAAARGVSAAGGVSVGILPGRDRGDAAAALTVALPTALGEGRNAVIVAAAEAVIACGMSAGTASEVALALATGTPVALVRPAAVTADFFGAIALETPFYVASGPADAIAWVAARLDGASTAPR